MPIPKKSLGQNFLMHAQIAERIVLAAKIETTDTVLEIGPGTGMLTTALLKDAKKVIAIEADDSLVTTLREKFADELASGRLELIHADIREFDPSTIPTPYKLVANIPYYITGEIIRTYLSTPHKPSSMTLLVQKEVAVRIARSKKESILSLSVKVYGDPAYCFTVPRGAFFPAPNVDSAVITIQNIDSTAFATPGDEEAFFTLIKTGFAHKRKQLGNNLLLLYSKESIDTALKETALRADIRTEDLTLGQWRKLGTFLESTTV